MVHWHRSVGLGSGLYFSRCGRVAKVRLLSCLFLGAAGEAYASGNVVLVLLQVARRGGRGERGSERLCVGLDGVGRVVLAVEVGVVGGEQELCQMLALGGGEEVTTQEDLILDVGESGLTTPLQLDFGLALVDATPDHRGGGCDALVELWGGGLDRHIEIGRASCREEWRSRGARHPWPEKRWGR